MNSPLDEGVKLVVFHHRKMLGGAKSMQTALLPTLPFLAKRCPALASNNVGKGSSQMTKCVKNTQITPWISKTRQNCKSPGICLCTIWPIYVCCFASHFHGLIHQLVMIQVQESGILISLFLWKWIMINLNPHFGNKVHQSWIMAYVSRYYCHNLYCLSVN